MSEITEEFFEEADKDFKHLNEQIGVVIRSYTDYIFRTKKETHITVDEAQKYIVSPLWRPVKKG